MKIKNIISDICKHCADVCRFHWNKALVLSIFKQKYIENPQDLQGISYLAMIDIKLRRYSKFKSQEYDERSNKEANPVLITLIHLKDSGYLGEFNTLTFRLTPKGVEYVFSLKPYSTTLHWVISIVGLVAAIIGICIKI